jgi:hypothetical protein
MYSLSKLFTTLPFLLIFTSILMLIFSMINYFDIFYFGLLYSEAFIFMISFTLTCLYTFFVYFKHKNMFIRFLMVLLFLVVLITILNFFDEKTEKYDFLVKPIVSSGSETSYKFKKLGTYFDYLLDYLLSGSFFGSLMGFGAGGWIRKLRQINLSKKLAVTISLFVGLLVSLSGINLIFLGDFYISLVLIGIAIFIVITVTVGSKKYS